MTRAPASGGRAAASTAFLLEHVAKLLAVDRSKEIAESVGILTSAKKLFVYGVGRAGPPPPAFALRSVRLGFAASSSGARCTPSAATGMAFLTCPNHAAPM